MILRRGNHRGQQGHNEHGRGAAATPLLVAGLEHLRRPGPVILTLRQVITARSDAMVPHGVGRAIGATELMVGVVLIATVVTDQALGVVASMLGALVYGSYTVLTVHLRQVPGARCGCSGSMEPVNSATVLRAMTGTVLSLLAMGSAGPGGASIDPGAAETAFLIMGLVLGLLLWLLPTAVAAPQTAAGARPLTEGA